MPQVTHKCEGINVMGYGIVAANQRKYLVANLLPGEEAVVEFSETGYGKVIKLITSSPMRIKPKCARYNECGGCHLQHCDYQMQLDLKTRSVRECIQNNGMDPELVLPTIGMKNPYNYRNKIQMVMSDKGKKVMAGFYEENTHKIVNVDDCSIQDETANAIIRSCKALMAKHKIKPFDEDRGIGLVRHIMIKRSEQSKQILVILVTVEETFPGRNNFVTDLRKAHPEITSIVQNINNRRTSAVLGDLERIVYGSGTIEDEMHGKKFVISAKTFYQVNAKQTDLLYQKAIEFAKPKAEDYVVDAYAGVGTIGIIVADSVKQVASVEINAASVKNAILNARINHVKNVRFHADDATNFMNQRAVEGIVVDILFVDPPRAGLDPEFIEATKNAKPAKIVYISCDPHTLARDLAKFISFGYHLKRVQPIDMFCQTYHVESVALLSLQ
jgi:23S rRNA (uracil1939-C5)-methyltransferase